MKFSHLGTTCICLWIACHNCTRNRPEALTKARYKVYRHPTMSNTTFRGLIAKWPSLAHFAADLDITENAAKQMRTRDSIAPEHWPKMAEAAKARRIRGVTLDLLAQLRRERSPRPLRPAA